MDHRESGTSNNNKINYKKMLSIIKKSKKLINNSKLKLSIIKNYEHTKNSE
jgi:hypothetical protein